MPTSLDDVLDEKPQEPAKPEAEPSKAAEAPPEKAEVPESERPTSTRANHRKKEYDAQGRDPDTGQFVAKDAPKEPEAKADPAKLAEAPKIEKPAEKPASPAQPELTDRERAYLRALEDERRKRQALEQQNAQRAAPEKPAEAAKTFWDAPEEHLRQFEQRQAERDLHTRLGTSEAIARSRYNDFEEKIGVFAEVMQNTPGLRERWLAAPDPGEFAYRLGKHTKELRDAGSIDELKAKIEKDTEARVRAQVEAEFKKKHEELEKARKELPGSLTDVRGAAPQHRAVFSGPMPLDDILKGR